MIRMLLAPFLACAVCRAGADTLVPIEAAVAALPPEVRAYVDPPVLTGTIYGDAGARKALFTFKRTATVSNLTVRAVREFTYPNGSLAAKEWVVYEAGKLVHYYLEEPESFVKGTVTVERDP